MISLAIVPFEIHGYLQGSHMLSLRAVSEDKGGSEFPECAPDPDLTPAVLRAILRHPLSLGWREISVGGREN